MSGISDSDSGRAPAQRGIFTRGPRRRVGVRIDMTPMVDIAFLLLIFFMVTTVFRQPRAIELNVPDLNAKVAVPETNVLTVFLGQEDATYYKIGAGPIGRTNWDTLFDVLRQQAAANPNLIILVKIDRQAHYERMVDMMDDLEDAHLERFSLAGMSQDDVAAVAGVK